MKRAVFSAAFIAAAAAWPLARAASQLEFDVWMRLIDKRSVSVQRHIAAGRADEALADARELERHYALMEEFFAKDMPADDAKKQSAEGLAWAAEIAPALEKRDFEAAAKSALSLTRACNDCHDNHKPFNR